MGYKIYKNSDKEEDNNPTVHERRPLSTLEA